MKLLNLSSILSPKLATSQFLAHKINSFLGAKQISIIVSLGEMMDNLSLQLKHHSPLLCPISQLFLLLRL